MEDIFLLLSLSEPLIDLILRLGGMYILQPVCGWSLGVLRGDDLDSVTILDLIVQWNQTTIDLSSHHAVTNCRVDGVGEVDGGGSLRQVLNISCWSEAEYRV